MIIFVALKDSSLADPEPRGELKGVFDDVHGFKLALATELTHQIFGEVEGGVLVEGNDRTDWKPGFVDFNPTVDLGERQIHLL